MSKKTLHHCIFIIRDQKRARNIDWSQACVQLPPPLRTNLERSICDLSLIIYIVFKDLMTFSGICLMKQLTFHHATTGFPVKWCRRNKCRNSILMKHHCASDWMKQFSTNQKDYSDLGNDTADQYGISALVSQMSFCGETSKGIAKCWLFFEAILKCVERGMWFAINSDYYIIEKASFHWLSFCRFDFSEENLVHKKAWKY